jgi:hypothetical protein
VLQQAALGMSNRQIGDELEIAEQTVKNHLSSAMHKLAIRDRTSAVVLGLSQGLISLPIHPGGERSVRTEPAEEASEQVRATD